MNNECFTRKYLTSPKKSDDYHNIETIKHKNPFLHIIKLSEKKRKTINEQDKYHCTKYHNNNNNINNQATKICHINHIALPHSTYPTHSKIYMNVHNRNHTPIHPPNNKSRHSKSKENTPTLPLSSPSDMQKEINKLKEIITEKEAQLSNAKKSIDSLIIENLTLKSKVVQYKDKFDLMINEGNIISKETILFNYLVGLYDEGNAVHDEGILPNFESMTYEDLLALEEKIGYVSKGFTKDQINKIKRRLYKKEGCNYKEEDDDAENRKGELEEKCVICQFNLTDGEYVKDLPCGHCYHEKCIDLWLLKEKNCPFCKMEIVIV